MPAYSLFSKRFDVPQLPDRILIRFNDVITLVRDKTCNHNVNLSAKSSDVVDTFRQYL